MTVNFEDLEVGKLYSLRNKWVWKSSTFIIFITEIHNFETIHLSGISFVGATTKHTYMSQDDFVYYMCDKLS